MLKIGLFCCSSSLPALAARHKYRLESSRDAPTLFAPLIAILRFQVLQRDATNTKRACAARTLISGSATWGSVTRDAQESISKKKKKPSERSETYSHRGRIGPIPRRWWLSTARDKRAISLCGLWTELVVGLSRTEFGLRVKTWYFLFYTCPIAANNSSSRQKLPCPCGL